MTSKGGGRCSKLNYDVLKETDANGDLISTWCIQGSKSYEAICTICNSTIQCKNHGSAAVKRHAKNLKHMEECKKIRGTNGLLLKPSQKRIDFSNRGEIKCGLTHPEKVSAAEVKFTVAMAMKGIPYSFMETCTMMFPDMFTDSQIAKDFTCSRTKASYLVSDGFGPHYREKLISEIRSSGVFYSVIVDETPLPEKRVQQMDVMVRFFNNADKKITVQHLSSRHIGHGTAQVMFDALTEALEELPKEKMLCFFTDGPNVMKSLKNKMQALFPNILDLPTCSLHKVHNSFAAGLTAFGEDIEILLTDLYFFFKHSSAKSEDLRVLQETLDLPLTVLVKHVSSRWLTLEASLTRFLEMLDLLKKFFGKNEKSNTRDGARYLRIKRALQDKLLLPKALFLKNVSSVLNKFLESFQTEAPLIHIFYDEVCTLVKTFLGRFLKGTSFLSLKGLDLKLLDVAKGDLWKSDLAMDIGSDTRNALKNLSSCDKNAMLKGARSFYITCTKKLIKTLPLDNRYLYHMQVLHPVMKNEETSVRSIKYLGTQTPSVISTEEVSLLQDEWMRIRAEPEEVTSHNSDEQVCVDEYWSKYFAMKDNMGNPKFPLVTKLFKAILCIPHGSADIERGFSVNKHILDKRSNLNEASINGIRQVISHVKRVGGLKNFKVDREEIKVARGAYKNYSSRIEQQKEAESKKRKESKKEPTELECLKASEACLQQKLKASQDLLESAEKNISDGLSQKNMYMIENGHSLLSEAKSKIASHLAELEKVRKSLSMLSEQLSKKCKK